MQQKALFIGITPEAFAELVQVLHQEPYQLCQVESGRESLQHLSANEISVVVCNESLIDGSGSQLLTRIQQIFPQCIRILIATQGSKDELLLAVNDAEVYRILSSPLEAIPLAKSLRQAMSLYRVARVKRAIWAAAEGQIQAMNQLLPHDSLHDFSVLAEKSESAAPVFSQDNQLSPQCIGELPQASAEKLSSREREIVGALGTGKRVKEIAQELIISTHTVRNHLKAIYRKLNVRSQFELLSLMARHARQTGLMSQKAQS